MTDKRKVKVLKPIREFPGEVSVCREWLTEETRKIQEVFKSLGKPTQSIPKNYIPGFMQANNFENMLEKCLKLHDKGKVVDLDRYIIYYGEINGLIKWNEYRERQSFTNSKEHKNMTDAEFRSYNLSRAVTRENMISRYGEINGLIKWNEYRERQAYTNILDYFIEQYGEEAGTEKYNHVNFLKGHSLESYIFKYGKSDGTIKYSNYIEGLPTSFYSNIASRLFSKIDEHIEHRSYYAPKNKRIR